MCSLHVVHCQQQVNVFYDEPKRKLDVMRKIKKAENQNQATKRRKHNVGKKIPGFAHNAQATGMLMHEHKNALSAKHLTT